MDRNRRRMEMLLSLAAREGVQVELLDVILPKGWHGLYVRSKSCAAIAINSHLSTPVQVWVLAHELGHHFQKSQGVLFSPFRYPRITNRTVDAIEEEANRRALDLLTQEQEWTEAEGAHPTDLSMIVSELELPIEAGISWERLNRMKSEAAREALVELSPELWDEVARRTTGRGGAQHTYQRLLQYRDGSCTVLTRGDFCIVRARAATLRGGWGSTFRKVARELEPQIQGTGGIAAFFNGRSGQKMSAKNLRSMDTSDTPRGRRISSPGN